MITRRAATTGIAAALLPGSGSALAQSTPTLLTARSENGSLRAEAGKAADLWSLGQKDGAALRIGHGAEAAFQLRNETPLPLTLHCQGLRGPNAMDGVGGLTQAPIPSGESFTYRFTPPDTGTFLLRPSVLGASAEPLERGLSGILIVEEANPPMVDRDEVILIDDWRLNEDGSLAAFDPDPMGRLGNLLTVNREAVPRRIEAPPGTRIRLRLANACNARIMRLRFDRLKPFVIAIDSQPTDTFEPLRSSLPFAPGSRYDVVVDFPEEAGATGAVTAVIGDGMVLVELISVGDKLPPREPLRPIHPNKKLPETIRLQNATRRELVLKAGAAGAAEPWTINGRRGDASAPLLKIKRGTPVVLTLVNQTPFVQTMHLHGHAFRLLHNLDDGWEPYFLDTVQIPESRTARIAFLADNPGKWLLASTIMERFDSGLWTWIEVS